MSTDDVTSSRTIKSRHRKLTLKMQYLEAELAEVSEYMYEAKVEFAKAYHTCLQEYSVDEIKAVENKVKEAREISTPTIEQSEGDEKEMKKLFRKIAGETHPDKLAQMEKKDQKFRQGLFDKAKKACENLNWYELSKLAETLEINIPHVSESHINMLAKSVHVMEQKIEIFKHTYAWQWYELSTPEERSFYMHTYVKSML